MRYILISLFIFLAFLTQGQSCYVLLDDVSGFDRSPYLTELESAACDLKNSLPDSFQQDFAVYDAGFYAEIETYGNSFTYEDAFNELVQSIDKKYYVLFAKQSNLNGIYTKFHIKVKLPTSGELSCLDSLNNDFDDILIELKVNDSYQKYGATPIVYKDAFIDGMLEVRQFINNSISCCDSQVDIEECLACNNKRAILYAERFSSKGLIEIQDSDIDPQLPNIKDYAKKEIRFEDLEVHPTELHANLLDSIVGTTILIITTDDQICTNTWDSIHNIIENEVYDYFIWHHIHFGSQQSGDEELFTKFLFEEDPSRLIPVLPILKGLGEGAIDAFLQAFIIYLIDDDIEEFNDAWSEINGFSVFLSVVRGFLPTSKKIINALEAAAEAIDYVWKQAKQTSDYSVTQAIDDFCYTFIIDFILGDQASTIFKKLDISSLSSNGVNKLADITDHGSVLPTGITIKAIWNLSNEVKDKLNIIKHADRGTFWEWRLHKFIWKKIDGWEHTDIFVKNFKALDLYHKGNKIGKSIKTTNQIGPPSWFAVQFRDHLLDLKILAQKKSITYKGKTLHCETVELEMFVPEGNVDAVEALLADLMDEVGATGVFTTRVRTLEETFGI